MINLREVRISISYFACAIAMILGIRLMTKYAFISNDAVKRSSLLFCCCISGFPVGFFTEHRRQKAHDRLYIDSNDGFLCIFRQSDAQEFNKHD